MLNVGLTGGIGSGKTKVAQALKARGAHVVDFDSFAHEAQKPHTPAWKKIVAAFGEQITDEGGVINRQKLGGVVFNNREKLKELCAIVHPEVIYRWQEEVDLVAKEKSEAIIIAEVPLLLEVRLQRLFDVTLLVYCPQEVQVARVMERNCLCREAVLARIAVQLPLAEKVKMADFCIDNSGEFSETSKRIDQIWEKFVELENTRRNR
ncbi:MAG: dephospho-CoA kinase [Deltaproteobacteria bacterium]|nr:dephospho-CoA kinase [Deltaproteobacteria bacterium]